MAAQLEYVLRVLESHRFLYRSEADLQESLATVLAAEGLPVRREVRLNSRDRIDLLVWRVGIEVKVAGQRDQVLAQLKRYAESEQVGALILVTSRARQIAMPPSLMTADRAVPVHVVSLLGGAL